MVEVKEVEFAGSRKLCIWLIINLAYILLASILHTVGVMDEKTFSVGYILLLVVNIIVGIVVVRTVGYRKNIVHLLLLMLAILGVISVIFAVNKEVAIFGYSDRNEGVFSILYYFSLMFLAGYLDRNDKKIVVWAILIGAALQCIQGIIQIHGGPNTSTMIPLDEEGSRVAVRFMTWAYGFVNNPNFFGTYMLMAISFALGLFLEKNEKKWVTVICGILCILYMYGLMISDTMSVVVGLGVVFIYVIVFCIKNRYFAKLAILIGALAIGVIIAVAGGKTTLLKDIGVTGGQVVDAAQGNAKENFGTNRFYIWGETLKEVPKHLIIGVGIDNFRYAFDGNALQMKSKNLTFDKAHNEYLQILITEGLMAAVVYIFMCGIIVYWGTKDGFKAKSLVFILPVVGYLVQAFFNISVIEVAPIFYIAMGFCINNKVDSFRTIRI